MIFKLSNRLLQIANFVDKNDIIADVGSDHGHLVMYLIQNKICFKAYAIDNKKGPFEILKYNTKEFSDSIIPVFSDGLVNIPSDCHTAIIAGLGAHTIVNIVKNGHIQCIEHFIIDSHNDVPFVRESFVNLGYYISNEKIINENGKYYIIIKFSKGKHKYTKKQLYFGPILLKEKNDLFKTYYKNRLERINRVLNTNVDNIKFLSLTKEKEMIEEVI